MRIARERRGGSGGGGGKKYKNINKYCRKINLHKNIQKINKRMDNQNHHGNSSSSTIVDLKTTTMTIILI